MADRPGWASDRTAALMSNLCILHCIALPLAALLPAGLLAGGLSVHALHGPYWLHWAMLLLAFPLSCLALYHGFRSHGLKIPGVLAFTGFVAMVVGALLHGDGITEPAFTVAGGLMIGVAHWRNRAVLLRS